MCGIAGMALNPSRTLPDLRARLLAMRESMTHRGPDGAGLYVTSDAHIGLATRRLAIRDLSPAGHMPMRNADGSVWITYNGELYNADELRPELERLGYVFCSTGDTEVILHGYEAWGECVAQRLRGMFAFAILDQHTAAAPRLFLARDRLGIKPLYYAQSDDVFLFASELHALQASGWVSDEINTVAVAAYLLMGSVPCPMTIYQDARMLEPGGTLIWESGRICIKRYWTLPMGLDEPRAEVEVVEQVRALLAEAVRVRLVSDVPLGAFLSGGLDSSTVVALMRCATNGPIRTCSMVFAESAYSEAPYARALADAVGAEHYERIITAQDLANEMERIVVAMDQPSVDGVNTYFVSQTAREAGLTVALSGLGGDELFGGYPNTFEGVPQLAQALSLTQAAPAAARLARKALSLAPNQPRWAKVSDALQRPASYASAYITRRGLFAPSEVKALFSPSVWDKAKAFDATQYITARLDDSAPVRSEAEGWSASIAARRTAWLNRAELSVYTHNQLLRDTDVMSMAHSLEVREPLLDHQLVEFALRTPAIVAPKQHSKRIMRAATRDLLPPLVRERRGKQGFTFPFDEWLKGSLRDNMTSYVFQAESALSGWFKAGAVKHSWEIYLNSKTHWSRVWALVVLGLWLEQA